MNTIPEINLTSQVQAQLERLEQEALQNKKEELAQGIVKKFYDFHKKVPSNVMWLINLDPKKKKNEILDTILKIYINNSNSLNCSEYSVYITGITQQWSEVNSLQRLLEPLSEELKNEVKLLFLSDMEEGLEARSNYRNNFTKQDYFNFFKAPHQFYQKKKDFQSARNQDYEKKMMSYDSPERDAASSLESIYKNICLLNFYTNNEERIELLNSIVSNLSAELEIYINNNPEKFKEKVTALHKKLSSSSLASNEISAPLSSPMKSDDENTPFRPIGIFDSFKKIIYFWKTESSQSNAEINSSSLPLTFKQKFEQELTITAQIVEKLKYNALFSNEQVSTLLNSILKNCVETKTVISSLEEGYINVLSLEEARILGRNVSDLAHASSQAALLPLKSQETVKADLEKIVLDTLGMSEALTQAVVSQKNEMLVKSIQVTNRLSNIRAQAQNNQQHMKLGK